MLMDTSTYRVLTHDPTADFAIALERLLNEGLALGVLDEKQKNVMLNKFPICAIFHALPKVHKGVFPPPP